MLNRLFFRKEIGIGNMAASLLSFFLFGQVEKNSLSSNFSIKKLFMSEIVSIFESSTK
ncbi:hypothetical protein BFO_0172 [Tannerella forsythia 92A2]|uniref:Uncharacterized protein n=1 Tax=Tannerella forsythia (strain ATCC 43037 / JCM 10827 / CCUG 21028 A / KCTC 5666 / FDC 338) TaxID=203275 RepID=G8UIB9_TANFA|nr:hypothetical protein BFO_0172 [Tannerella forsythia 92A2]BAR47748.1 hypothetical protein TF3313_0141 [Tannerella forsythia 3313]